MTINRIPESLLETEERGISVSRFKKSGVTDTDALLQAVAYIKGKYQADSMRRCLIIPYGMKLSTTQEISVDFNMDLFAVGAQITTNGNHNALTFRKGVGVDGILDGLHLDLPDIKQPYVSDKAVWTGGYHAVRLCNVRNSRIETNVIDGFTYGMIAEADEQAFSYNEVHLGRFTNCKSCVAFKQIASNGGITGWVNENNWYGGKFEFISGVPTDRTGSILIDMPARDNTPNAGPNRNVFYKPTFEGTSVVTSVRCGGDRNTFISPRLEGNPDGSFLFDANSRANTLYNHELFPNDLVVSDLGTGNRVEGHLGTTGRAWTTSAAVASYANLQGDSRPAVGARTIADTLGAISVALCGDGSILWLTGSRRLRQDTVTPDSGILEYANGQGIRADSLIAKKITAAPANPEFGMITFADGTTWNPGYGSGLYAHDGTSHRKIKLHREGTTVQRPTSGTFVGMQYFDTTLNKPIWRNAANNGWVDAMGTTV